MESTRYERGLARLREVDGSAGDKVIESLADISPDLGKYIIEFGFGDIYSRPASRCSSASWPPSPRSPRWARRSHSSRCTSPPR